MDLQGMRWPVLIGSVLVTFAVLFGGFALYRHQAVDGSIVREYRNQPGVHDVTIDGATGGVMTVTVSLGPEAELARLYNHLQDTADRLLGPGRYRLVLQDQRGQDVSAAFYEMHFSLQEANATGRFTAMAEAVRQIAADAGLTHHRVDVGDDYIYVTLEKDGQYLYEVLPRRKEG